MKQTTAPAIGEAIRLLREEKRLSQSELAKRSRLTQATVSRIESGARRGDIETLALIAAGLGLALWILVRRAEGMRTLFTVSGRR
jgi:transcriptional regulator with XRE-family HTH domain